MKANYKNWIPKGMIWFFLGATVVALALCLVFGFTGLLASGTLKIVLTIVFAILAVIFCRRISDP